MYFHFAFYLVFYCCFASLVIHWVEFHSLLCLLNRFLSSVLLDKVSSLLWTSQLLWWHSADLNRFLQINQLIDIFIGFLLISIVRFSLTIHLSLLLSSNPNSHLLFVICDFIIDPLPEGCWSKEKLRWNPRKAIKPWRKIKMLQNVQPQPSSFSCTYNI